MNKNVLDKMEELMECRKNFKNGEYGNLNEEQFQKRMHERFADMFEKMPTVFEKTLNGFFEKPEELKRLKMAMGIIDKTNAGNLDREEGEKQFGQHLVDVYVTPKLT